MFVRYEWGVDLSDPVTGTYDEVSIVYVMSAKDFHLMSCQIAESVAGKWVTKINPLINPPKNGRKQKNVTTEVGLSLQDPN